MDLAFNHPYRTAELLRDGTRLANTERSPATWHGNVEFSQQVLGLIFMDIHGPSRFLQML